MRAWATIAAPLRHLPSNLRGKTRLAHLLLRHALSQKEVVVEDCDANRFLVPQLAEPVAFHLLIDGAYERETKSFILSRLSDGDVFVDVGANIGVFTVSASKKVGQRGRVLAIEASPRILTYLEKNAQLNHLRNVTIVGSAASDVMREGVDFYEAPIEKFGMGSMAPQFNIEPILVKTRTLDDLIKEHQVEHVAVLKVDVEGHEASVFRGALQLLKRPSPPAIVFEFCDWAERRFDDRHSGDAQRFLMTLGYDIFRLSELHRGGSRALSEPLTKGSAMLAALKH
jgi:FkbM family methyltransferase